MKRPKKPAPLLRVTASVTFEILSDGSIDIRAIGRHGTLTVRLDGADDPFFPGTSYHAQWGLVVNNTTKGLLVEDDGRMKWLPAPKNELVSPVPRIMSVN